MIYRVALLCAVIAGLIIAVASKSNVEPFGVTSHWVKLDTSGKPIDNWAGPWSCVLDKKTGLIWENKDDSEGIHDGFWSYSWFEDKGFQDKEFGGKTLGVENWGDCHFEKDRCDTQDLITRVKQEKTCGLSAWRLPTADELATLVIDYQQPGEPVIDLSFFPHTKRGDYWTADANKPLKGFYQYLGKGATALNFINGEKVVTPYRNAAFVRLVTSEKSNLQ